MDRGLPGEPEHRLDSTHSPGTDRTTSARAFCCASSSATDRAGAPQLLNRATSTLCTQGIDTAPERSIASIRTTSIRTTTAAASRRATAGGSFRAMAFGLVSSAATDRAGQLAAERTTTTRPAMPDGVHEQHATADGAAADGAANEGERGAAERAARRRATIASSRAAATAVRAALRATAN